VACLACLGRSWPRLGGAFLMTDGPRSSQSLEMDPEAGQTPDSVPKAERVDFRGVFQGQFNYVWNSLRRLGVPSRDLEDLTHDVFLQVHRQMHRYDRTRPIRPWLFGFAFRIASDYRRLVRHRVEILDPCAEGTDPIPTVVDRLVSVEALSIGYAALDALDIDRRAVFILHELDGCPIPEVASSLLIPLNTAYSRLRLAREQFKGIVHRLRARKGDR
jgi:RNA polymerase sigma-70 factor (ECF subfamily)